MSIDIETLKNMLNRYESLWDVNYAPLYKLNDQNKFSKLNGIHFWICNYRCSTTVFTEILSRKLGDILDFYTQLKAILDIINSDSESSERRNQAMLFVNTVKKTNNVIDIHISLKNLLNKYESSWFICNTPLYSLNSELKFSKLNIISRLITEFLYTDNTITNIHCCKLGDKLDYNGQLKLLLNSINSNTESDDHRNQAILFIRTVFDSDENDEFHNQAILFFNIIENTEL
jgi:hypothetical protein